MHQLIVLSAIIGVCFSAPPELKDARVPTLDGRIVGGDPVFIEDYRYTASLLYSASHRCGAVIISETILITAAHCTDGITAPQLSIRAGSSTRNSGGIVVQVAQLHQHPFYNSATIDYDVTVLRLATPLTFGSTIGPATLPPVNHQLISGEVSVITGWGALTEGGSSPTQLQAVEVPVVSLQECRSAYGASAITDRMMCAGIPQGGKDACQGDSGGPLVIGNIVVGLVSWGRGCAQAGYPGVNTHVANQEIRQYIIDVSSM